MDNNFENKLPKLKSNRKLETIILIILLHAILPALFIIFYLNLGQREAARNTFKSNLVQITQFATHTYEEDFLTTKTMLQILSDLPDIKAQNKEACETISRSLLNAEKDKQYVRLGAIDKEGYLYCTTDKNVTNLNLSDRKYFQQVAHSQRFVLGEYSIGKITGSKQLVTAYPVYDTTGEFNGMVGASIDLTWIGSLAKNVKLPSGYTITVLDKKGIVLARHPYEEALVGTDSKKQMMGKLIFSSKKRDGTFISEGLDQQKRLYAFSATKTSLGEGEVYVVVGAPASDIEAFANQNAGRDILILLLVILSAVFICSFDLHYILFKWKK